MKSEQNLSVREFYKKEISIRGLETRSVAAQSTACKTEEESMALPAIQGQF